jgi:hypothetical protein
MILRTADRADLPAIIALLADDVLCMQITYIPGLGRHGAERSLIEAVRVRRTGVLRGSDAR